MISQDNNNLRPLVLVLEVVQMRYDYQFNYTEDTIKGIYLIPPPQELSFSETLNYLRSKTGLIFKVLNDNFVSVQRPNDLMVCGYLKSKDNQTALTAATVSSGKNSTITDENGFFELMLLNQNETVSIRHLGYRTLLKSAKSFDKTKCEDLLMEAELQSLAEVVISDYIVSGINKVNNGTYEIDFSNFDILPGLIETDVLQSVQAFPGIQSENETVSNINIRGGTHDQNLILWDDIKMYQSGHFFGLISMFNPQITQKVSLLKNGTDVTYTDGISGTIAMKTDDDVNQTFKGSVGVNFIDANAFVDIPIGKKSSIQIAARKAISDFWETPTYKEFFERISQNTEVETNQSNIVNSDKTFDFYDTSLRWLYKISEKDEIRLNFINVADELVFDENAIVNSSEESRRSKISQNSIAAGFQYKRTWDDRWQTIFDVHETDYKLQAFNANVLDSQRFLQENSVSETSVKLNTYFRINKRFQLLGGHQFVETKVSNLDDVDRPRYRLLISEVVRTYAAYSQVNFAAVNRQTNFSFGGRINYIDKFKKTIIEPRFSFNQKFLNYFTFEVLGEFKHQLTSQIINFQSDFLGIEKRRWQLSNDQDIPIIESKQISTGISYNHYGWLLSAEGYYKTVDGITTQSQGFQNQYEFVKTAGSYDVKGVDFLVRKRLGNFNAWLSYAFMDNTYHFNALPETDFASNYDIQHYITLGLTYSTNHFKIASGVNWHTGKPATHPFENNTVVDGEINYQPANSSRLDDYLRLNVSALYDCNVSKKMKGTFGVSVWNVLNDKNVINTTYRVNDGNSQRIDQNSLGLTPNFVARLFF
ncbi:TonB-dependent receptor [Subsaxibacter sp. CAU 1640]|uniref:TonB-dependent receptor n=1 Tax=Subsaxibacter sp. CAU 1640 TaxID=2933271 RepID=UPI002006815A|nr:TonB-dependent receptor [Subsaxibacter sp. CAU 1640]MCK7590096.1 TonB-dependent receptor [Subsaxibacter sp. CAU 1640]